MCYLAERDRSALNGVGITRGEPPKLGSSGVPSPWDWGVADPVKTIEIDTDRSATYDFLLTFHSNHWPVS